MLRDIDLVGYDSPMQALVEQQIGLFRQRTPFGESARICAVQLGFSVVVNVMTGRSGAGFAVIAKHLLQFFEQIGFRAEVAEVLVAALGLLSHFRAHLDAIIAMEGVALDIGCGDLFPAKNVLEGLLHRRGSGAG